MNLMKYACCWRSPRKNSNNNFELVNLKYRDIDKNECNSKRKINLKPKTNNGKKIYVKVIVGIRSDHGVYNHQHRAWQP